MEEHITIKPIETKYKGFRFRSRLEARWAVFMDALGIEYEYEKEGYDLGEEGWYLPDFWLPDFKAFLEIKPTRESILESRDKFRALCKLRPVIVVGGYPDNQVSSSVGFVCFNFVPKPTFHPFYWAYTDYPFISLLMDGGSYLWNGCDVMYQFASTKYFSIAPIVRNPALIAAYDAGRQARFEHGEQP